MEYKHRQYFEKLAGRPLSDWELVDACRRIVAFNDCLVKIQKEIDDNGRCDSGAGIIQRTRGRVITGRSIGTPYRICDKARI